MNCNEAQKTVRLSESFYSRRGSCKTRGTRLNEPTRIPSLSYAVQDIDIGPFPPDLIVLLCSQRNSVSRIGTVSSAPSYSDVSRPSAGLRRFIRVLKHLYHGRYFTVNWKKRSRITLYPSRRKIEWPFVSENSWYQIVEIMRVFDENNEIIFTLDRIWIIRVFDEDNGEIFHARLRRETSSYDVFLRRKYFCRTFAAIHRYTFEFLVKKIELQKRFFPTLHVTLETIELCTEKISIGQWTRQILD